MTNLKLNDFGFVEMDSKELEEINSRPGAPRSMTDNYASNPYH